VVDSEQKVLGLGTLSAGDHLGGLRLFGETASPLTAVAEGEVGALVLERPGFARLQQQKPQTAMKLLFALSQDFGQRVSDAGTLFIDFAQFAARRTNMAERGVFATYDDLGMGLTPLMDHARMIPGNGDR
jgi:CRP-like cAMP-binding protein